MTTSTLSKAATGALIALTLAPISVEATITSVTVNTSRDYEHAGGYAYAEITVHGTVDRADGSVGVYAVPAVLIHPRPIFRAALENLTRWTSGNHRESPPPSQYFRGSVDAIDAFVPMTDVDGHFAGGVRLPHVESTMHGRVAGAPLGRHTPLNPLGLDPFNLFALSVELSRDSATMSWWTDMGRVNSSRAGSGAPLIIWPRAATSPTRTGWRSSPPRNVKRCRRNSNAQSNRQQDHDELRPARNG